ncbi:hypothetical protein DdX_16713 [Ditylenchus destructor]|uniref:C2H2-type domain-containing protein n=1 Tax=Ditylenchus destructor TaxID=166010 RepID=A0AAD4MNI1_9BILA|nr:hypothetical protein DdX_16713 [Ditylenchus destructor]
MEIMFAIVSIALLFNANVVLTEFYPIRNRLPFSNVMVPYDVGKRHKIDTSDPYMGYAPTSSNGNRHYIRVSDSFDCDNDVAIFEFMMCYLANFGFSHGWGGVGSTPKEVAKKFGKRWIVGLEVINKLIVHHTKCDLIERMSNPGNATNNRLCSAKEPASGKTRHRNKKKHGSGLMDHDGDDEASEDDSESDGDHSSSGFGRYKRTAKHRKRSKHRKGSHKGRGHIKTLVNFKDGPIRLYLSQTGENERWLRLHCTDCGGWIDIVEDCHHRSVHYGGAPAQDLTEDVREHLPQCEKGNQAFKCDSYKVKFTKDCRKEIAKLVEYEQENGIIPVDDDDEPQEESTTTTTTRAQFGIGDMLMPIRKKPN